MTENPFWGNFEREVPKPAEEQRRTVLDISRDEFIEIIPTPVLNLPNIREIASYTPKDGRGFMVFLCESIRDYRGPCVACGSYNHTGHGAYPERRLIHDVNVGNTQVDIYLKVRRRECRDCGATFGEPMDAIMQNRQMTRRLYEQIRSNAFRHQFKDVAFDSGYTVTTVAAIFDEYAAEFEEARGAIIAPRVLGIDEKHIVHAQRGMFVDIETGRILEMTPNNDEISVLETIKRMEGYEENIKLVTMDMSSGYKKYVEDLLPDAKIIIDKYHVMQALSQRVSRTRSKIAVYLQEQVSNITDPDTRYVKKMVYNLFATNGYLFKYNHKNLSEKNRIVMADVCATFPELNHLRLLKEGFERIYEAENREEAESFFLEWQQLVPGKSEKENKKWADNYGVDPAHYAEFQVLQSTMAKWSKYIFNYFDKGCQFTNAATEGLNQLVDRLNKLGNGYSFKRLRAKALYASEAAPTVRYTAKEFKKAVLKEASKSGLSMDFMMPFETEFVDTFKVVPDDVTSPPAALTIYNYTEHPLFDE